MRTLVLVLIFLFASTACNKLYDYKVNFNEDPRILRGAWIGKMVEQLPQRLVYIPGKNQLYGFVQSYFYDPENPYPREVPFVVFSGSTGQEVRRGKVSADLVSVVFDPAGDRAYGWSGTADSKYKLIVYKTSDWTVERELLVPAQDFETPIFNFSSRHFYFYDKDRLRLWNLDTLTELPSPSTKRGILSDDSSLLLRADYEQGWGYRYSVENLQTHQSAGLHSPTLNCKPESYWVEDLQFSADSRKVVGKLPDGTIGIWSATTGELLNRVNLGSQPCSLAVNILAVNADATRLVLFTNEFSAGQYRYGVLFWDSARGIYSKYQTEPLDAQYSVWGYPLGDADALLVINHRDNSIAYSFDLPETRLRLVSEAGLVWEKEPRTLPLKLDLNATLVDSKQYKFEGSIQIGTDSPLALRGVQKAGADHTFTQGLPPRPMTFTATVLTADGSTYSRLSGASYIGSTVPSDGSWLHGGLTWINGDLEAYSFSLARP